MNFSRRELLLSGMASAFLSKAWALGSSSQLDVAELIFSKGTISRPGAWERALFAVIQSTSIEANPRAVQIEPEDPAIFAHPFAVLIGNDELPPLSDKAAHILQQYLSYGGFLFIDDASSSPDGPFTVSVRKMCKRLFPTRPISPLGGDHSIYRSFFLLERPLGRTAVRNVLEGVQLSKITPLVFCPNDLSGALDRGPDGMNRYPVVPGGESQRKEALKLAINLVMYSLTSNYKHDQAHVAELMREGRLR